MSAPDNLTHGLALHHAGHFDEAAGVYAQVLADEPENPDALMLLGALRRAQGQGAVAVDLLSRAVAIRPHDGNGWHNLGNALMDQGDKVAAHGAFSRAIALTPQNPESWFCWGATHGEPEGARGGYEKALALDPTHVKARHNLANILLDTGDIAAGVALMQTVVTEHPALPEARYNLARGLLALGEYTGGFAAYEARWQTPSFTSPARYQDKPQWRGQRFRHLLIHAEQGFGDTIQFVRFVAQVLPFARLYGGRVTVQVPPPLVTLLKTMMPAVAATITAVVPDPETVDMAVPMMSLPLALGVTLGSIPRAAPYLSVPTEKRDFWKKRLGDSPFIALCWQGNPASPVDKGRSIKESALLAPLLALPHRFVCLHKLPAQDLVPDEGPTGWRVAGVSGTEGMGIVAHPGPDFDNGPDAFMDAATVMSLADSVVTTDTAMAHLAGALACPTAVMLKHVPDWRWMQERADTPWYPTMRLFRQPKPEAWPAVIGEVVENLRARGQNLQK